MRSFFHISLVVWKRREDYLIEQIELDLQNSFSTIQEIAYRNGFSSQAHFTKFFKKKVGVPPSNFRKKK